MKQIICMLFASIALAPAFAQLKNTKWEGTINGDNPRKVTLNFKKDTMVVYSVLEHEMVETMTYTSTANSFTLLKLFGQSDCDKTNPGKYNFQIKGNKMTIKLNSDQCSDRSTAIDATEWTKVKTSKK